MYNITITKIEESKNPNTGTFLQTPFWTNFKARHGWINNRFNVDLSLSEDYIKENEEELCNKSPFSNANWKKSFELCVMNRYFARGMFSIAYIPLLPSLPFDCTPEDVINASLDSDEDCTVSQEFITAETQAIEFAHLLKELSASLKKFLPENTIAIRFDPDVIFNTPEDRDLFNQGLKLVSLADKLKLKKNKVDIQPPDSTLVDLTADSDIILGRMHQKWRYNIRLSEKKGVQIKTYKGDDPLINEKLDVFYALTKETNVRDGNSSHGKLYYEDLIKSSAKEIAEGKDSPLVSLYVASHEGDEIASIMTLFSHDEAIYLYGASSNKKRNLMPNHLLQWTAMQDAKAYGSKIYDMYGMPPEGKDQNHPMHGLYMFKANFGGKNIHRPGSWDIELKFVYKIYSSVEKLRAFWHKKIIKKIKHR